MSGHAGSVSVRLEAAKAAEAQTPASGVKVGTEPERSWLYWTLVVICTGGLVALSAATKAPLDGASSLCR